MPCTSLDIAFRCATFGARSREPTERTKQTSIRGNVPSNADMPTRHTLKRAALGSLIVLTTPAAVVTAQADPSWTKPYPPFHIAGSLYYVGGTGLANYLITTPQGHILINSDLEANVPIIRASVEQLGFKFGDIKILLISHAHWDHNAGSAMIKQLTGAKYMVMDADVSV